MRNMSFALTTEQIINCTKTVTRRMGWKFLKPGDKIYAVKKCMGLKKGEKVEGLAILTVKNVRQESLKTITDDDIEGINECAREGFPWLYPGEFVEMFCKSHKGCKPETIITRIEFDYDPL
jgi:hypothetical protein